MYIYIHICICMYGWQAHILQKSAHQLLYGNINIYIHVWIYVNVYTYIYIFMHLYLCMYLCILMYIYIHINIYTYICVYIYIYIYVTWIYLCSYLCIYLYVYLWIHIYIYSHMFCLASMGNRCKFSKVTSLLDLLDETTKELTVQNVCQQSCVGAHRLSRVNSQKSARYGIDCVQWLLGWLSFSYDCILFITCYYLQHSMRVA